MRNDIHRIRMAVLCGLLLTSSVAGAGHPLRVLILTGANNHDWQATTPVLRQIFDECPRFQVVDMIDDPSTLNAAVLKDTDVVVSNWSGYPKVKERLWGPMAEQAFVEAIKSGRGFVVFHAASATCQDWPEFQQLVGLTWGLDRTAHGAYHTFKVVVSDRDHPITGGMKDFWITDELWHNMVSLTGTQPHVLGQVFSEPDFGGTNKYEPVVIPTELGKGRGLNIVLGHDAHAMRNIGWRTLLLRGMEWAATGRVTIPVPENWPTTAAAAVVVELDKQAVLKAAAAYRYGQPRDALGMIEQWAAYANSIAQDDAGSARDELADRLVDMLKPDAAPEVKGFICRQLAVVGSDRHVPAIAALLGEEHVSDHACFALTRMATPANRQALRAALSTTSGLQRIGVVNALADIREVLHCE